MKMHAGAAIAEPKQRRSPCLSDNHSNWCPWNWLAV